MRNTEDGEGRGGGPPKGEPVSETRVRRAQGAGPEAEVERGALVVLLLPIIKWWAAHLARQTEDPADFEQDFVTRFLEGRILAHMHPVKGSLVPWIVTCLLNLILNGRASERLRRMAPLGEEEPAAPEVDLDRGLDGAPLAGDAEEARRAMERRLEGDDALEVFRLLVSDVLRGVHRTQRQAAAALGFTFGRYRDLRKKALRSFKEELERLRREE